MTYQLLAKAKSVRDFSPPTTTTAKWSVALLLLLVEYVCTVHVQQLFSFLSNRKR
jgi:hypothetical protein